LHTDAIKKMV